MRLVDAYKSNFVGKMYPDKLLKILRGEHFTVQVKNIVNGVTILTDGSVLKCIGDYYEKPNKSTKGNSNQKNFFLRCRNIRKDFNLDDIISDADCRMCHITCILREKTRELKRKKRRR